LSLDFRPGFRGIRRPIGPAGAVEGGTRVGDLAVKEMEPRLLARHSLAGRQGNSAA
jgi:hypothetical protein